MKKITNTENFHGGWVFNVSKTSLRIAIKNALRSEFKVAIDAVELGPVRVLNYLSGTFVFRARIGPRVLTGTAKVENKVHQPEGGDGYISNYVSVSYNKDGNL